MNNYLIIISGLSLPFVYFFYKDRQEKRFILECVKEKKDIDYMINVYDKEKLLFHLNKLLNKMIKEYIKTLEKGESIENIENDMKCIKESIKKLKEMEIVINKDD